MKDVRGSEGGGSEGSEKVKGRPRHELLLLPGEAGEAGVQVQ